MQSNINRESVVRANEQVVSCELEDGAALLDLTKNVYYGLNPVAAEVWAAVQDPASVSAISETIRGKFDTGASDVSDDVISLLRDMHGAGLVCLVDAPAR